MYSTVPWRENVGKMWLLICSLRRRLEIKGSIDQDSGDNIFSLSLSNGREDWEIEKSLGKRNTWREESTSAFGGVGVVFVNHLDLCFPNFFLRELKIRKFILLNPNSVGLGESCPNKCCQGEAFRWRNASDSCGNRICEHASQFQAIPNFHSLVNSSTCLLYSVIDLLVGNPRTKRIVESPITKWRCLAVFTISVGHL